MKTKVIVLLASMLFMFQANARDNRHWNYFSFAPLGLVNKQRVVYERGFSDNFSAGFVFSNYYGTFRGPRGDLYGRYYLLPSKNEHSLDGMFLILQGGFASFQTPYTFEYEYVTQNEWGHYSESGTHFPKRLDGERSMAYGVGIGAGYKFSFNRFFLDTHFRLQSWYLEDKPDIEVSGLPQGHKETYKPSTTQGGFFRSFGPGAVFSPTILFGYMF